MAVKHVKQYFSKICDDYKQMLELAGEIQKGEIEFDDTRKKEVEQQIQTVKDNYMRWSYMIYLLNLPNRKSKHNKYNKQISKKVSMLDKNGSLENILNENKQALDTLKG